MGATARHAVDERFGMRRMVEATQALYLDQIDRRRRRAPVLQPRGSRGLAAASAPADAAPYEYPSR